MGSSAKLVRWRHWPKHLQGAVEDAGLQVDNTNKSSSKFDRSLSHPISLALVSLPLVAFVFVANS